VFAAGLTPIADGDIFWHLAGGRQMVQDRAWLRVDPFSVSALGRPWIDVHWLFQLGAYATYCLGDLRALVLAKAALTTAGALGLLYLVEREAGRRLRLPFALALVAALFAARHLLLVRPVILTVLFITAFLLVLERFRHHGRWQTLLVLPALQIFWVNCQGLAPIGLVLVAASLLGALVSGGRSAFVAERGPGGWRPLAVVLGLCAAASFITPYGTAAALLPVRLLLRITPAGANVFAREVAENIPPFVLARTAPGQIAGLPVYLGCLAVAFVLARRGLRLSRLLLVAIFTILALMANRNILLLYWIATPLMALEVAPTLVALAQAAARRARAAPSILFGLGVAALAALDGVAVLAAVREPALAVPTPFRFPTESTLRLAGRPGQAAVFTADHQGGYLIWTSFPRYRPYLDTRLILRTGEEFAEYLDLLAHPERFDAFQARHHFGYAVLPTAYPDRYLGLAQHLASRPDWTLLFTDGSEALFAYRASEPGVDLGARETTRSLLASLAERYGQSPVLLAAARVNLARLDLVLGHGDEAENILVAMPDPAARALHGRCRLVAGDLDGAETIARALLEGDADDVASLNLLALVALARGDPPAAASAVRRALRADPFDAEARAMLERLRQ
jgi:tetratricopeptide (TPR) repeat protein